MTELRVSGLTIEYSSGGYAVRPVDGLDFTARAGQLTLLLGPSGCGKSSLLSCLGGILKPAAGSIRFGDVEVTDLRGRALNAYRQKVVGIVFQAFNLIPSLTALENVAMPMQASGTRSTTWSARGSRR